MKGDKKISRNSTNPKTPKKNQEKHILEKENRKEKREELSPTKFRKLVKWVCDGFVDFLTSNKLQSFPISIFGERDQPMDKLKLKRIIIISHESA